ncbi:DUF305 domain-containing protein [Dyadobacter sediminis]|uniref:DUF305 domain-containing protein n=1 Tax=Dyadobacter sediminis TaxID=1493691 RepID=A0A5R9KK26_9BACT|nr:DUF305 domain-containing protein [Dyadobacter sediminis]TLU96577.1 DUF305 domain-containing protein [Dyadobacter sediminis]GGB83386.1 hypothetical protein GCM10011325_08670 [Dyadobacter sediminis]
MKPTCKILGFAATTAFSTACSDHEDNNPIFIQAHDGNQMMALMHNMMDEMHTMKVTQDPDMDYASMMSMHHMGVIDMAQMHLLTGKDAGLRESASMIIEGQNKEMADFQTWLLANRNN